MCTRSSTRTTGKQLRPLRQPYAAHLLRGAIGEELFFALVPHSVGVALQMVSAVVRVLFFALLLWIVVQGIRSRGLRGWLVLPALPLVGISIFQTELVLLHLQ
jgi:hypothetical protein